MHGCDTSAVKKLKYESLPPFAMVIFYVLRCWIAAISIIY